MSESFGLGGISLFELFKLEAEAHCAALGEGLLALEKAPTDRAVIEPLMRAAHSIKGAARIVGLDVLVALAHAMEDCFLAARDGEHALTAGRVDQLLKAVDVLSDIRSLSEADLPAWTQSQAEQIASLVAALKAEPPAARTTPASSPPPPEPAPPTQAPLTQAPAPRPAEANAAPAPSTAASSVRVGAGVLNRMMFLAGEATVETARFQSLRAHLAGLKVRERALGAAVQSLREILLAGRASGLTKRGARGAEGVAGVESVFAALTRAAEDVHTALADQAAQSEEAFRRMEDLSSALYTEVLRSRMRPFSEGVAGFPRMVRDIARELGKAVTLRIEGESVLVDRDILQKLESPLTHMIRNSLDHGIEPPSDRRAAGKPEGATIVLAARHQSGMLTVQLQDDGRGIDIEVIRRKVVERRMVDEATAVKLTRAELLEFLFLPGFSTKEAVTELSGRGVGLNVVQSMVQEVSGTVTLDSELGRGATFTVRLPVTRSVIRGAVVRIDGEVFAVPLARLDQIAIVPQADVVSVQGRMQFTLEGQSIGLIQAAQLLTGSGAAALAPVMPVLVIGSGDDRCGLVVQEVCAEEDLVVRPLDARLGTVPHISAIAIRADGTPVFVVDVDDLLRTVKQWLQSGRLLGLTSAHPTAAQRGRRRILVVDDSITVREVERQLLQRRGYEVDVAVDGREGYNALRAGRYDLLLTDVDMPRMTGIELITAIRREPKFADLPIIIVSYKDREEDRLMGLEAGATAYLTKSSFQDDSLIRMVEDMIGAPM